MVRPHESPQWLWPTMPRAAADGQCQKCAAAWLADRRDVTTAYALGISTPGPSMWEEPPPCSYTDPEIFFPDRHDDETSAYAIRTCIACPLRAQCLAYSLHLEQGAATTGRSGIWAGASPRERRALHEHAMAIRSREARREAEV